MGRHVCHATVLPGLEKLAQLELGAMAVDADAHEGFLRFSATDAQLYRLHLRSRLLTRVFVRVGGFEARTWSELAAGLRSLDWPRYLPERAALCVEVICRRSRWRHTGRIAEAAAEALGRSLHNGAEADGARVARIQLRIEGPRVTARVDASGERLDRRGYRRRTGPAPMRPTLAAGVLAAAGWRGDAPLIVPMCGSGTLAIEAAMIAARLSPGLGRDFALMHWPGFRPKVFAREREKAEGMVVRSARPVVEASDIDARILESARLNAESAGVEGRIAWSVADFFALRPAGAGGLVVLNPPYGRRLRVAVRQFYGRIGRHLRTAFAGWRAIVLCPDAAAREALGKGAGNALLRARHGGRWVEAVALRPVSEDAEGGPCR